MTSKQFFDLYNYTCAIKRADQREGQVLYNMLWRVRPDLCNGLQSAGLDPFSVESRRLKAMEWIELNWSTEKEAIMGARSVGPTPRTEGSWVDVLAVFWIICVFGFLLWIIAMCLFFPMTREDRARQAGYEAVKIHDAYEQGRQQALKENQSERPSM